MAPRLAEIRIIQINTLVVREKEGFTFYRLSDGKRMSKDTYVDFISPRDTDEPILVKKSVQPEPRITESCGRRMGAVRI